MNSWLVRPSAALPFLWNKRGNFKQCWNEESLNKGRLRFFDERARRLSFKKGVVKQFYNKIARNITTIL